MPTNALQAEGAGEGSTQECAFVLMPCCCRAVEGAGENKKTLQATSPGPGEPDFMQIKDSGRVSYLCRYFGGCICSGALLRSHPTETESNTLLAKLQGPIRSPQGALLRGPCFQTH